MRSRPSFVALRPPDLYVCVSGEAAHHRDQRQTLCPEASVRRVRKVIADSVRNGRTASSILFSIAARTAEACPATMTPILLLRIVAAAWFLAALCGPAVADDNELISELNEEVVQIPVTVGSATGQHAVSL